MQGYPHPNTIQEEMGAQTSFNWAAIQAHDQIHTAIRAGACLNNMSIKSTGLAPTLCSETLTHVTISFGLLELTSL